MKKQIFTIILFTIASLNAVLGQFKLDATGTNDIRLRTSNTDRMTILTNGNVGIGTVIPLTKLHILGNENDGTTATLKIRTPLNSMLFDGNEISGTNNVGANTGNVSFNTNSAGNIYFSGGGNVGIGTVKPSAKLEINGDLCLKIELAQPTTNTDYIPFNRGGKSVVTFDPYGNIATSTVYGFDNPGVFGTILHVINGKNNTLILKHNHDFGGGNFADSIQTNTLADITITGRGGALLVYDTGGWRLISYSQ
jgi:hypothetical protein